MSNHQTSGSPFRWGVIGAGIIANKVFRELVSTGRHVPAGVFSRTASKARAFADKFGGRAYPSAEDLLSARDVDGVYVATPHSEHYRFAKLALQFKKPVLVEKSFTVNAPQAEALSALSDASGVYCGEAMWMRFSPVFQTVKSWIDVGAIGGVTKIEADFSFNLHVGQSTDRVNLLKYAGGALLDVGVYTVSLAEGLLGTPRDVLCRQRYLPTGVDSKSFITLRYPNGAVAELKCGIDGAIRNTATVTGERGKIKIPLFFAMPRASVKAQGFRASVSAESGYRYEFDRAAADILAGKTQSDPMTHRQSVDVMWILDRCRKQCGFAFPDEIERL